TLTASQPAVAWRKAKTAERSRGGTEGSRSFLPDLSISYGGPEPGRIPPAAGSFSPRLRPSFRTPRRRRPRVHEPRSRGSGPTVGALHRGRMGPDRRESTRGREGQR